jgi:hypothetical protein
MTFKLSKQIDDVGSQELPYALYSSYIQNNAHRFPKCVLDLHDEHNNAFKYYSVCHDGILLDLKVDISFRSERSCELVLMCEDEEHNTLNIGVGYKGVFGFNFPDIDGFGESTYHWRYDQFLYHDPYQNWDLKDKMFRHEIEWVGGEIWSIVAREVSVYKL